MLPKLFYPLKSNLPQLAEKRLATYILSAEKSIQANPIVDIMGKGYRSQRTICELQVICDPVAEAWHFSWHVHGCYSLQT